MRMQDPRRALPTPSQIYAGFTSIIRRLGGQDPGTKGIVRKDDDLGGAVHKRGPPGKGTALSGRSLELGENSELGEAALQSMREN